MKPKQITAALLTVLLMAACGSGGEESAPASGPAQPVSQVPAAESSASEPPEILEETSGRDEPEERETDGIAFPEEVLVDEAGIRITAREFVKGDFSNDGIRLLIENDNPRTCLIECPLLSVNGYQLSGSFTAEVAGGKKMNSLLELPSSALKSAEIGEIHSVSAAFSVYEREEWRTVLASEEIVIFDDGTGPADPADPGTEIFREGGVTASARMVRNDPFWGTGIVLYFENEGPDKVYAEAKNLSVDGYMMEGYWGTMLWPGKRAVGKIYLLDSDFTENDIEEPTEAELAIGLCDPDTMQDIVSGTGRFSVG